MSLKARIEADHNTLTDVVRIIGETRGEMHLRFDKQDKEFSQFRHEMLERFEQQDKRFEQQDKRFEQQDKRFDQQDKEFRQFKHEVQECFDRQDQRMDRIEQKVDKQGFDIAEMKEMLQVLLSR